MLAGEEERDEQAHDLVVRVNGAVLVLHVDENLCRLPPACFQVRQHERSNERLMYLPPHIHCLHAQGLTTLR